MTKLKLSVCQFDVVWNSPMANLAIIEELTVGLNTDLLVLPEMFNTGYVLDPSILSDPLAIRTQKWLEQMSQKNAIIGSVAYKQDQSYFNSIWLYQNSEKIYSYNKAHTFVQGERQTFTEGRSLGTLDFKGWKMGLNICYDLRFPVWCRAQDADIMLFCANWPEKRKEHWYTLLKARAIENQCYVVGVNRVGKDQNNWEYNGDSVVFDYKGQEILNLNQTETCETVTLDFEEMLNYRQEMPFLADKDLFQLVL
jgi:omega-amidase